MKKHILPLLFCAFTLAGTELSAQNPDAAVEQIVMDDYYSAGGQHTVDIKFRNAGTTSFSGVILNWSIDGGSTVNSYNLAGFPFSPGSSFTLAHSVKVVFSNPGSFTNMKVWTSNPGGMVDANPSNDTLTKSIFVNTGNTVAKNVMIEEFTTSVCQFCPDGAYTLENVLVSNPNAIGLGIHAGFGSDGMTLPEHTMVASAFTTSAPAAAIDRFRFAPGGNLATATRSQWNSRTALRSSEGAPVDVVINGTFNNVTRQAIVTINSNFVDFPFPGDLRVGLYVVEDSVVGPTAGGNNGWNQTNFYHNQSGHPFFGKGNPIIGYAHRHVVRDVFPSGNPWGESGVIPTNPAQNSSYSKTYTFQINSSWDVSKISMVAFVSYYGASTNDREILNAGEVKLNDIVTGLAKVNQGIEEAKLYPNPTHNQAFVEFKLKQSAAVQVQILDMTGKLVQAEKANQMAAGSQLMRLDVSALKAGIYFVRIQAGDKQITRKLSILD